jgi:predicted dehydrogenase
MSTRRQFLTQTLAATSALGFPALVHSRSPNSKVNLAFIGTGGRGGANLGALTKNPDLVNVVALCDVNRQTLDASVAKFPGAKGYQDFRKLYEQKDVDAYVVSVAEHTHAVATLPALLNKKPVYCEKPLTHNVREAKIIMDAAAKAGVPTQMGTQIHGMPNYRRVVELVQSGAIGRVKECHIWVSRAWGLQSEADAKENKDLLFVTERPKESMTPPDHLDWDLWLGPAPYRPYHDIYFPGPKWYRWWDFGNGTMSDLGSHWNDLPWWALNLDAPTSVESTSPFGPAHAEIAPASMTAKYEYPARGDRGALTLYFHQGVNRPQIWHENETIKKWSNGVLFIGDKGMLISDYGKHQLLPEDQFKDFQAPKPFIPDSPGQHEQWLNAVIHGGPTDSPFDTYAGPLTIANHLGNVAYRVGKKLEWDAVNLKATNAPEADVFLNRVPRKGWEFPV